MPIIPTSFDNIKVGYISETEGYVKYVSLASANSCENLFLILSLFLLMGMGMFQYLNIDQVNALTPKSLLDLILAMRQIKMRLSRLKFFGGRGVGARQIQ